MKMLCQASLWDRRTVISVRNMAESVYISWSFNICVAKRNGWCKRTMLPTCWHFLTGAYQKGLRFDGEGYDWNAHTNFEVYFYTEENTILEVYFTPRGSLVHNCFGARTSKQFNSWAYRKVLKHLQHFEWRHLCVFRELEWHKNIIIYETGEFIVGLA